MRKKNQKSEEGGLDANAWMVTFSDLLTLMMTFFVMLLTMSAVNSGEVKEAFGFFDSFYYEEGDPESQTEDSYGALDAGGSNPGKNTQSGGLVGLPFKQVSARTIAKDAEKLEALLNELAHNAETKFTDFSEEEANELKNIAVANNPEGITVYLPDSLFFKTGDSELNLHSTAILKVLGNWVQKTPYTIKIEGHSYNTEVKSTVFPSNWELSVSRATNIMRYFIKNKFVVTPMRISAYGYGEFQPLVSNDSIGNRKKNRRIEIFFKKPKV
jgi:chemotaxis protein MotB